jgi:glycerate kinase
VRILAAPDKFRGTASSAQVAAAIASGGRALGHQVIELPLADGGEGTVDVLGGANRETVVAGPFGPPARASWRLGADGVAVIEAARACGLAMAGGIEGNDPLAATSRGVGELVVAAIRAGARRIVVGLGGTACTDGGWPAVEAIAEFQASEGRQALPPLELCCDVDTEFLDAAGVFGPQKGADAEQVRILTARLATVADRYRAGWGIDVTSLAGSGAAGGLAGGLAVVGGRLVGGFDFLAGALGLQEQLDGADLVFTGEGRLDATSFSGKVIGGVLARAARAGRPVVAIVGAIDGDARPYLAGHSAALRTLSLTEIFGIQRSRSQTVDCVRLATELALAGKGDSGSISESPQTSP